MPIRCPAHGLVLPKKTKHFLTLSLKEELSDSILLSGSAKNKRKEKTYLLHYPKRNPKFSRYNMKCRGKPNTTWNIPRSIMFSPLYFMFNRGKSIVALGQCVAMWIPPCLPIPSVRWQLSGTTWMFGTPHTFISTDHVAEFTFFLTLYPPLSFLPLCRSS